MSGSTTESSRLKGIIGGVAAGKLAKHRDIHTVGELLDFWPRRYRTADADLGNPAIGDYLVAVAQVEEVTTRSMRNRRGRMLEATISDGRSRLRLTFFDARGHERKLLQGREYLFAGQVTDYRGQRQLSHPGYATLEEAAALGELGDAEHRGLIPIYRHVPGVHPWTITRCVRLALGGLEAADDAVPPELLERRRLPTRIQALHGIHAPTDRADVEAARRRLRYEEALTMQCILGQRRAEAAAVVTQGRHRRDGGLLTDFDARLPFELTTGQHEVSEQILSDLAQPTPMNRLLQGDVGSGKTVVALRAMLAAIDAGGQAALLAPTEVLAGQHASSIRRLLGDLAEAGMLGSAENATRVALVTGSLTAAQRRATLLLVATAEAGIVVGTHALLEEQVIFDDLALVVVDEQHRFGVEQRDALRAKGSSPPHVLVMTATPIPRTVAMTVFGDMETSTLRELPAGRQPIETHVVPVGLPGWLERTWQRVAEEIGRGRQAYVVCPRIGDDGPAVGDTDGLDPMPAQGANLEFDDEDADGEAVGRGAASGGVDAGGSAGGTRSGGLPSAGGELDEPDADAAPDAGAAPERPMASVVETAAQLAAHPALGQVRMGILHGRMTPEEKEQAMGAFSAGELDLLVSTTVIEVGVDVPNASAMVILDADRFGVSQLHQLRGRVGRGGHPGICLLLTASESPSTTERLQAVAATTDGFALARLDLTQRREGDVLGTAQHGGRTQLQHLSLLRDEELITQARADAGDLLMADPDLMDHPALRARMAAWLDPEQASYLEKG